MPTENDAISKGFVQGSVRTILRLEGFTVLAVSVMAFAGPGKPGSRSQTQPKANQNRWSIWATKAEARDTGQYFVPILYPREGSSRVVRFAF